MGLCDDSDEERHDRFRSERNTTTLHNSLSSNKSRLNSPPERDDRRHRRYRRSRSRTRTRSRSRGKSKRTERNHHSERHSISRESSLKRKSRSSSRERRSRHKERSSRKSDDDRRRRSSPRPQRVDTFLERFERRRPSPVDNEEPTPDDTGTMFYHDVTEEEDSKKRKDKKHHHHKREKRKRKKDELGNESLEPTPKKSPSDVSKELLLSDDAYGPALPEAKSELKNGRSLDSSGNSDATDKEERQIYGPILPTSTTRNDSVTTENVSSAEEGEAVSPTKENSPKVDSIQKIYGPSLPQDSTTGTTYGPALPPTLTVPAETTCTDDVGDLGIDTIGPLPPGMDNTESLALSQLEARAALLKKQLENKDDDDDDNNSKRREAWMLELPDAKRAAMGLGARKFRSREGPDMSDRSSWTDTPADKERKRELARLGIKEDDTEIEVNSKVLEIRERDKDMEKRVKDSKRADKSLLELHQKEMKKKKKKEEKDGKVEERRPFSRDIDLQTNKFDEAQKKSIIKKAQLLDSRFSRGESKFL